MVSQAWHAVTNQRLCALTFGLDIGIVGALSAWRCCECEVNSSDKKQQNCKHTSMLVGADQSEFISGGLVSVYLVYGKVVVVIHAVFASSCGIQQSKLPTQHVRPESGRWFLLVWCRHVCVSQNIKRCGSFEEPVHWISQCICDLSRLIW